MSSIPVSNMTTVQFHFDTVALKRYVFIAGNLGLKLIIRSSKVFNNYKTLYFYII